MISDVYLANLFPNRQGVGVYVNIIRRQVLGWDNKSNGDYQDPDHTI